MRASSFGDRGGVAASVGAALRFVRRHPLGVAELLSLLVVLIVVAQNLEPTSVDLLFWSIGEVPKLVLISIAMLVGAIGWEIVRRLFSR